MIKKKKTDYCRPTVEVEPIEMEQGIAANSAEIRPGTNGSNMDTPVITDWTAESIGGSKNVDF